MQNSNNSSQIGKQAANQAIEEAMKALDQSANFTTPEPEAKDSFDHQQDDFDVTKLSPAELDQLFNPKNNDVDLIKLDAHNKQANLENHENDIVHPLADNRKFTVDQIQAKYNNKIDNHESIEKIVSFHETDKPKNKITQYMDKDTIDKIYQINHQSAPTEANYQDSAETLHPIRPQQLEFKSEVVGRNGQVMAEPHTMRGVDTPDRKINFQFDDNDVENTNEVDLPFEADDDQIDLPFDNDNDHVQDSRSHLTSKQRDAQTETLKKYTNLHPSADDLVMDIGLRNTNLQVDQIENRYNMIADPAKGEQPFDHLVSVSEPGKKHSQIKQYMNDQTVAQIYQANHQPVPSEQAYKMSARTGAPFKFGQNKLQFKGDVMARNGSPMVEPNSIRPSSLVQKSKSNPKAENQNVHDEFDR